MVGVEGVIASEIRSAMLPQPRLDRSFAHPARLVQPNQPVVPFQVLEMQLAAIQEIRQWLCDRRPLGSIQKRMILRPALEQAAASAIAVGVVCALETSYGGF
jgi:hypothetical protein